MTMFKTAAEFSQALTSLAIRNGDLRSRLEYAYVNHFSIAAVSVRNLEDVPDALRQRTADLRERLTSGGNGISATLTAMDDDEVFECAERMAVVALEWVNLGALMKPDFYHRKWPDMRVE